MIFKNGDQWDGWLDDLKQTHGKQGKVELKKQMEFKTVEKYHSNKTMTNGKGFKQVIPYAANLQIPVEYTWKDPKDGTRHMIRYAEQVNTHMVGKGLNKDPMKVMTPRRLTTDKGFMKVNRDQLDLYWFLINHPMCGTGRMFSKEEKPQGVGVREATSNLQMYGNSIVFNEVNKERELVGQVELDMKITTAKNLLYQTTREAELRNIYAFYDKPNAATVDENEIKLFLKGKIEGKATDNQYPSGAHEFIAILEDKAREVKGLVSQAQQLEVIEFVRGQRTWLFKADDGDTAQPICSVPKLTNEIKGLAEWIEKNDSGEVLDILRKKVKQAEEHKKKEAYA